MTELDQGDQTPAEDNDPAPKASGVRWVAVAGVTAVVLAGFVLLAVRPAPPTGEIAGVTTFAVGQGHVDGPVTYPVTPPPGGEHSPQWLNCGTYAAPVVNENAVHSLEHGAVWVAYRPDLPAADVERLRQQLGGPYEILAPYPGLESAVVASAWGVQLKVEDVSDPRLAEFVTLYRQGPTAPEPGAPCTGGLDGDSPVSPQSSQT